MRKYNNTAPVQVAQNIPEGNRSGTNDALLHKESAVVIAVQHSLIIFGFLSPFFIFVSWKVTKNMLSMGDRLEWVFYSLLADWAIATGYYFYWLRKWNKNIIRLENLTGLDLNNDKKIGTRRRPTLWIRLDNGDEEGDAADTELDENARNIAYLQSMAKDLLTDNPISQNEMKRLYGMPQGIWKSCTDVLVELHLIEKKGTSKNSPFGVFSGDDDGELARKYLQKIAEGDWKYLEDVWAKAGSPSPPWGN